MGRKIPGRKHHGVRDIEKQQQDRLDKLKHKINAPPADKNDQEIPKSLLHVMELKRKVKSGEIPTKKKNTTKKSKKNEPVHFKPSRGGIDGPTYLQARDESDRAFMYRVNKVVQEVIDETAFAEKYRLNVKRHPQSGEVEAVEKREDPLDTFIEQLKRDKKVRLGGKKKKKTVAGALKEKEEKLSKTQKKLKKFKVKKEKKAKDIIEDKAEVIREHLQFGEVAHAPPKLVKPRRVERAISAARPGSKDLLLKNVLKGAHLKVKVPPIPTKTTPPSTVKTTPHGDAKSVDKTGKRKNLSAALRRQLDKQQMEIIQAYKVLKKKKYNK